MHLAGLLVTLAIGLVLAYGASVVYCAWVLTHPPRRTYAWAVSRSLPGEPGEVQGWGPGWGERSWVGWGATQGVRQEVAPDNRTV